MCTTQETQLSIGTEPIKLFAIWMSTVHNVNYEANGGEGTMESKTTTEGSNFTVGESTFTAPKGKEFAGWNTKSDGSGISYTPNSQLTMGEEDITLYAQWRDKVYTVTYDPNGGTGSPIADKNKYVEGANVVVVANTFKNADSSKVFKGWNTAEDGSGKMYQAGQSFEMKAENTTLYAQWGDREYKIIYNSNDGSGTVITSEGYVSGTELPVGENKFSAPVEKEFIGWNTKADGSGQEVKPGAELEMVSGGITLYAQWKNRPSGGGSSEPVVNPDIKPDVKPDVKPDINPESNIPSELNGKDHYAYILGYNDGLVHPELNMTRAGVATMFFRLLNDDIREANITKENSFNDVNADSWYNTEVSTMAKMGIIKGYEDGSFKPDAPITRAEFSAMAIRFAKNAEAGDKTFTDINGHWAESDIKKAAEKGWVTGYPDNTFKPDQDINRAEAMAMVNRILVRNPKSIDDLLKDMKTWPDNMNTDSWFYLDVQEATNSHDYVREADGHEKWTKIIKTPDWTKYQK